MKLFVWEGVLEDWTSGLVCAFAEDEKQAWQKLYEKDSTAWWNLQGHLEIEGTGSLSTRLWMKFNATGEFVTDRAVRPKVIEAPEAFVVWGGG